MRARARPDPIQIIEAGYTWNPNEKLWIDDIVRAASPYNVGGGVLACSVHITDHTRVGVLCKTSGVGDEPARAVRHAIESMPVDLSREVLAPTEFVGNAAHRMSRIAHARHGADGALVERVSAKIPALWALISGDPSRRTLMICFPRRLDSMGSPDEPFPHRDARSLGLVGAHLTASLRLRALVSPSADDIETEAVLTPRGKVLHAAGAANSAGARTSLVEAVRASETARGRLRHSSPDEALALWTALVQGRWTILDCTERDGKRLLLARKNPLGGSGLIELTPEQRDVAWLAAHGHSYKYIAYELGVPLSTVASRLRRAMQKLRVRSRTELLQKLGLPE